RRLSLGGERVTVLLVPLELVVEMLPADHIAVADSLLPVAGYRDDAVLNGELVDRHRELLGGALKENASRFRRRVAQRRAAALDAGRSRPAALVARERGVAHDDGDAIERHVELLGDDLADRDIDALPHVHLAEE